MIAKEDILSIGFLKKQVFTGSYRGMRYRLWKEGGEPDRLVAEVWPQPYSSETAPEAIREQEAFPFDEGGRAAAVAWLNERYEGKKEIWEKAGL